MASQNKGDYEYENKKTFIYNDRSNDNGVRAYPYSTC